MGKTLFDVVARADKSGSFSRVALTTKTREEAVKGLNKAFGKAVDGIWTDKLGQQFTIIERFETREEAERKVTT